MQIHADGRTTPNQTRDGCYYRDIKNPEISYPQPILHAHASGNNFPTDTENRLCDMTTFRPNAAMNYEMQDPLVTYFRQSRSDAPSNPHVG